MYMYLSAARMIGEAADFDVFISYRVESDSDHAAFIYKMLTAAGVKVWWDRECLVCIIIDIINKYNIIILIIFDKLVINNNNNYYYYYEYIYIYVYIGERHILGRRLLQWFSEK